MLSISGMSGLELLFVICAAFGTILFVVRLILMFIGGGDQGDADGADGAEIHDGGGTIIPTRI